MTMAQFDVEMLARIRWDPHPLGTVPQVRTRAVPQLDLRANLEPITLSDEYLKNAGRIAQARAVLAARRLAAVWAESFAAATESMPEVSNASQP